MNGKRWAGAGCLLILGMLALLVLAAAVYAEGVTDEDDQQQMMPPRDCAGLYDGNGAGAEPGSGKQSAAHWSGEQRRNAATITAVAKKRHLPPRAAQIALATAMQESALRNRTYGDRDSLGLFQQRPSQGWGTTRQVRDPVHASGEFYTRLMKIKGWEKKPLTRVAQSIQRSRYPDAYARWESAAKKLVTKTWKDARLPDVSDIDGACNSSGGGTLPNVPASRRAKAVIANAVHQVGEPYVWGGGDQNGPTKGGFDCSGLMLYAFHQGTGGKVNLPRTSQEQRRIGEHVPKSRMQPGDLIVINNDGNWGHVGLYLGDGRMVHAPRTGKDVEETELHGYWEQFPWDVRRAL